MTRISATITSPPPPYRKLRAFAFDPGLSRNIGTYGINEVTLKVPWDDAIGIGPADDYLEVIDYDPASNAFYPPVDLQDKNLLAQDGLPPAEGNPQFHQQMVYAVARTTIGYFESALGRKVLWSPHRVQKNGRECEDYVGRLRIYPHAFRDANAFFDPDRKALLFGYFPAPATHSGEVMPGETVFTCLSHDIIAHETTHAIIDGLHPYFIEPTNPDVAALHEALADIIALFQHFSSPDVLRHQIARTGGDLEKQNLLGELAWQFGQATGAHGALRSALGHMDAVTGVWVPHRPDPLQLQNATECHDRGAVFVAAIFDAFLAIYKARIRDLLRIASGGTGVLPAGEIHPDLANRLADEAAKTAGHMLRICIRALDYCPCVDPEAGDYLRALITADRDLVTDDPHHYRLAVIEAFRQWGIYPRYVRSLSEDSLVWHVPDPAEQVLFRQVFTDRDAVAQPVTDWDAGKSREEIFGQVQESRAVLRERLMNPEFHDAAIAAHLVMETTLPSVIKDDEGRPVLDVNSVRPVRRIGPDGQALLELVVEITQQRGGYLDPGIQADVDGGKMEPPDPDFILRGGCTLIVDARNGDVRYCIHKDLLSDERLERTREYIDAYSHSPQMTYLGNPLLAYYRNLVRPGSTDGTVADLYAMLHRPDTGQGVS